MSGWGTKPPIYLRAHSLHLSCQKRLFRQSGGTINTTFNRCETVNSA